MRAIYIAASNVWDYFLQNKGALKLNDEVIACNEETGVVIAISNQSDYCVITVTVDDRPVLEETVTNAEGCKRTVGEIYDSYFYSMSGLTSAEIGKQMQFADTDLHEDPDELSLDEVIEYREAELNDAIFDLLNIVTNDQISYAKESTICEEVKDYILEYLAREHGLSVYRPMFLEDEKGEFFEEYPYEVMEFDD